MNYSNGNLLLDYARRTQKNLEFLENAVRQEPEKEIFEVTQLINSLLGLLVFPFERMRNQIPSKPLQDLEAEGWVVPEVVGDFPQVDNLRELIRYLRNAVAHFNIEFIADKNNQISGVYVWNTYHNEKTWKAEMTIAGLRNNVYRFIELILSFEDSKKTNPKRFPD
ncbi:MAG: HEPN family nuclease [Anaerolineales bacterium]